MRFILEATLPVERFNETVRDGSAFPTMERILADAKPEAAYFCDQDGRRCAMLVLDLASASEIPRFAEPWMLNFDATIRFRPVMTPEDLKKADLAGIASNWT